MAGMTGQPYQSQPQRGTLRYQPGVGYASGALDNPMAWASDADYTAFQAAKTTPKPEAADYVTRRGYPTPYTPHPELTTNLYSTGPSANPAMQSLNTAVSGVGTVSAPAYEQQQQTQLESVLSGNRVQQEADIHAKEAQTAADVRAKEAQTQAEIQAKEAAAADAAQRGQMELASRLQAEADQRRAGMQVEIEKRRLGYIPAITGAQSSEVTHGNVPFDEAAARAAAFGAAKDQAGKTALASLRSLQDVMAESGKTGSSQESQGIANIIGGAGSDVNDFTRTQLMSDLNRAADIADQTYRGRIQQRGQNLSMIPSLLSLITATSGAY